MEYHLWRTRVWPCSVPEFESRWITNPVPEATGTEREPQAEGNPCLSATPAVVADCAGFCLSGGGLRPFLRCARGCQPVRKKPGDLSVLFESRSVVDPPPRKLTAVRWSIHYRCWRFHFKRLAYFFASTLQIPRFVVGGRGRKSWSSAVWLPDREYGSAGTSATS